MNDSIQSSLQKYTIAAGPLRETILQNTDEASVADMMRCIGVWENLNAIAPPTGTVRYEAEFPFGSCIFLGRFADGQSVGWVCYELPNAKLDGLGAAHVRERIEDAYGPSTVQRFEVNLG